MIVPGSPVLSGAFYRELSKLIELPKNFTSLTLRMEVDSLVEIECKFYPEREVQLTTLSSIAHEYAMEHGPLESKRFRLAEIVEPETGHAQPAPLTIL